MSSPRLYLEKTGETILLRESVTTIGRGLGVDVSLSDLSVSRLHAELVRRGPHVYVYDLGLSANGTHVNGRPVGQRLLREGDVIAFGVARTRIEGLEPGPDSDDTTAAGPLPAPDLTRRELEVLASLCRPALHQRAFVAPSTAQEIAQELVVTDAAVKQHLLRLYAKFHVPEGVNRRFRLANKVINVGVVRPLRTQVDDGS